MSGMTIGLIMFAVLLIMLALPAPQPNAWPRNWALKALRLCAGRT